MAFRVKLSTPSGFLSGDTFRTIAEARRYMFKLVRIAEDGDRIELVEEWSEIDDDPIPSDDYPRVNSHAEA